MDNWLDLACAHLSTQWLKLALKPLLVDLVAGQLSTEGFASRIDDLLNERNLRTISQQKNPRSNIVQALKAIDEHHPAIAIVGLTTEQYRNLNEAQRGRLAERETKFFSGENAERLVEKASRLLDSAEWSEIAAGLAVLIGRRISEILLSEFEWKSEWSLWFSQMAKKKDDGGRAITIEIPTLAPAQQVLDAIKRLQAALKTDDLKLDSLSPKMAKQRVNARYSAAVATRCDEQFNNLIPPRHDKDNLYTHVFRAVYATIATHWFCPPSVPPHSFKAEIQGHFTISQDGKKLPNFSARANYDDYAICTSTGDPDGRLGIKLGVLPNVQVIDAFRKDAIQEETSIQEEMAIPESVINTIDKLPARLEMLPVPQSARKTKRPELDADDVAKMTELMAKQGVVGHTAEVFHALLKMVETGQQQQVQTVQDVAQTLNWFTKEVESLRAKVRLLEQERERTREPEESIQLLQQENQSLRDQLHQTQARLEGIQKLLGMGVVELPKTDGMPAPTRVELKEGQSQGEKRREPNSGEKRREPEGEKRRDLEGGERRRDPNGGEKRRDRTATIDKIHQAVDALISWNTAQDDGERQLRISIPTIKGLASAMGANYQPAIQEVLKEREAELEELHRRLMLGSRHNASVKGKDEILKAIARDYLGLDNWQEVKY